MRLIAGAIVTAGGSLQWGIASLTNSDTGMGAIASGIVLCIIGLVVLFGFLPKELTD